MREFKGLRRPLRVRRRTHGKPHPGMFLTAVRELGAAPEAAIVLGDAAAGVEAARACGMAAIGIARAHDADLLSAAGADIVVTALDEVDLAALSDGRLATKGQSPGRGSSPGPAAAVPRALAAQGESSAVLCRRSGSRWAPSASGAVKRFAREGPGCQQAAGPCPYRGQGGTGGAGRVRD
ncbi:MAG TPA: hypothetical protein DHU96_14110 [Actinobacteria bacterium]|nr:hypothetical protein [Actinomycetota bacterium]